MAIGDCAFCSAARLAIQAPSVQGNCSIEAQSATTDAVAESIKRAVEEAEHVSGLEIQIATVNLSGEHLQGENKGGVVAVAGAGREISDDDVARAIESASAMPLPAGWEIIEGRVWPFAACTRGPLFIPQIAACVRFWTRILRRIALTWTFTVASAMSIFRAMHLLELPSIKHDRIAFSRGER